MSLIVPRRTLLLPNLPSSYPEKLLYIGRQQGGQSCVGLWLLDERSGSVAKDRSGRGNDGQLVGITFVQPGVDLLAGLNGGFETAGAGGDDVHANWVETKGDGTLTDDEVVFRGGAHSLKLTGGATPAASPLDSQTIAVVPWTQEQLTIWVRGDGTNAGRYRVYDLTNSADIVPLTSTGVTAAVWTPVVVSFAVPGGCVSARVDVLCPNAVGGFAHFDDISLMATAPNGPAGTGLTAPYFDGVNDYCNVGSASFYATFNPLEGTFIGFIRAGSAGVWTDGADRTICEFRVDSSNFIDIYKTSGVNQMAWRRRAGGGTIASIVKSAITDTAWLSVGITWDVSRQLLVAYYQGAQVGASALVGTWSGTIGTALLGALTATPTWPWSGPGSVTALFTRALSPTEMWHASQTGV